MNTNTFKKILFVFIFLALCGKTASAHPHLWLYYIPLFTFSDGKLCHIELQYCMVQYPPMTCKPIPVSEVGESFSSDYPYVPHVMINGAKVKDIQISSFTNEFSRANGVWKHIVYELPDVSSNTQYEIRFSLQSGDKKDPTYCMTYATGTNVFFTGQDFTLTKSKVSMFGVSLTAERKAGHTQPLPVLFKDISTR